MKFAVAPHGAPLPKPPARQPRLAPLGKKWRGYTAPSTYELVRALTADGEWLFERFADGTWGVGHVPTQTEVKGSLRSPTACRAYVGSGKARADLERIQAAAGRTEN